MKLVNWNFALICFGKLELDSVLQVDAESHDPVVNDNGVSYLFLQHNNVYLMAASRQNCNAASILFFLHRIVDVSSIGKYKFHSSVILWLVSL